MMRQTNSCKQVLQARQCWLVNDSRLSLWLVGERLWPAAVAAAALIAVCAACLCLLLKACSAHLVSLGGPQMH
jgi:hypothetical protein